MAAQRALAAAALLQQLPCLTPKLLRPLLPLQQLLLRSARPQRSLMDQLRLMKEQLRPCRPCLQLQPVQRLRQVRPCQPASHWRQRLRPLNLQTEGRLRLRQHCPAPALRRRRGHQAVG